MGVGVDIGVGVGDGVGVPPATVIVEVVDAPAESVTRTTHVPAVA